MSSLTRGFWEKTRGYRNLRSMKGKRGTTKNSRKIGEEKEVDRPVPVGGMEFK